MGEAVARWTEHVIEVKVRELDVVQQYESGLLTYGSFSFLMLWKLTSSHQGRVQAMEIGA
jgi:hypothetical protein